MALDLQDTINEYIIDSKEHIQTMEKLFLELEKNSSDDISEIINTIFRSAHTIKGGALFLGFEKVVALSGTMETLLGKIRENEIVLSEENLDALTQGNYLLSDLMDDIENPADYDISNVLKELENLSSGDKNKPILNTNNDLLKYLYCLQGELCMIETITGNDIFTFLTNLVENGNIVNYQIRNLSEMLDNKQNMFQYIYSTELSLEELAIVINFPEENIIEFTGVTKFAIEKGIKEGK